MATLLTVVVTLLSCLTFTATAATTKRPKIIVQMIIDDLGHADSTLNPDVDNPDIPTPHLQSLQDNGVRLSNMHSQPVCSPTRSALMTGRFPFRDGMQHLHTIFPGSTAAIPLSTPTLPELLAAHNFTSSAVGKWHLGYASFHNTPTGRGFANHMGYFQGATDYYNKTSGLPHIAEGFDFWDGTTVLREATGSYSVPQYLASATQYIEAFANNTNNATLDYHHQRMFLYYSHQSVHKPLEAAGEDDRCNHIEDYWRRVYCSMMVELDDAVGELVRVLNTAVGDDWVILCMGDNGGMVRYATKGGNRTHNEPSHAASVADNRPLRGSKTTLFQGGVHATAFVAGGTGMIPSLAQGTTYEGLMHACDLAATVLGLGGVNVAQHAAIDGIDHWDAIIGKKIPSSSLRDNVPLNIVHNGSSYTAIRFGEFKLIVGAAGIVGPLKGFGVAGGWFQGGLYPATEQPPPHANGTNYLFNLTQDPYEHRSLNLVDYASVVEKGLALIRGYMTQGDYLEPQSNIFHLKALPALHGGVWAPFLD